MLSLPELACVHDRFLSLSHVAHQHFRGSLGANLLLRSGFDAEGVEAVVAASIAGAVSLCIHADGERLREGLRAGLIDFVVAHPDEALRILKNEIRRALPVSVGLVAHPESSIAALVARGLQPDLLSGVPRPSADILVEHGAIAVPEPAGQDVETSLLDWTVAGDPVRSMPRIARIAADSLDESRADTLPRRRWLSEAPRYLGRSFGSRICLRMTEAEILTFLPRVKNEIPSAAITRDGERI
jgi:hypothetical protein